MLLNIMHFHIRIHLTMHLLLKLLLVATGASALFEDSPNVAVLTKDNFVNAVLKSNERWLINFYAPWCVHCKRFASDYEIVAAHLKGQVKVGAVDITREKELKKMYKIRKFPTMLIFDQNKTKPIMYTGRRKFKNIIVTMLTEDYL